MHFKDLEVVTLIYAASLSFFGSRNLTRYSLICAQVEIKFALFLDKEGITSFVTVVSMNIASSTVLQ